MERKPGEREAGGPDRRQILVGAAGVAGLGMFGLLGGSGCRHHIWKDPELRGRPTGPFCDWSLISRSTLFAGRLIAPHPLGGCPMADDARGGVVDHAGRVFDPGRGVHAGLHVLDASIIPHSLAATPLLTICALAERAAELIVRG